MASHEYYNTGHDQQSSWQQQQGHEQPNNYGQNLYSNTPPPADQYGYNSGNAYGQPPPPINNEGYNPYPQDQSQYGYGSNGPNPAPYIEPAYQPYPQGGFYDQSQQQYQQPSPVPPYQQPSPQPYYTQPVDNNGYSPQPAPYDQTREQEPVYPTQSTLDPNAPPVEGERGLMGAIAGGVAGGYAGHKVNHGFIGAIGGAYAGHKLQDALKDQRKKDKKHGSSGRRNSSSSSSSGSSSNHHRRKHGHNNNNHGAAALAVGGAGAAAYATHNHHHRKSSHSSSSSSSSSPSRRTNLPGNFSATCTSITLDRDYDLIASCATRHRHGRSEPKLSAINLNAILSNEWGQFKWSMNGRFGDTARNVRLVDRGRVLEAELGDGRGGWRVSRVRLDERICNNDGDLQVLESY